MAQAEICYSLISEAYKPGEEWMSKKADSVDESDRLFMEIFVLLKFMYVFYKLVWGSED